VLGHALYMRLIHGGKTKNDDLDAEKIERLWRGGNIPMAYVYPKGLRETRDLLRRRNYLVRKRAELITHVQILNSQYNLPPFGKKLMRLGNGRAGRPPLGVCCRRREPGATTRVNLAAQPAGLSERPSE